MPTASISSEIPVHTGPLQRQLQTLIACEQRAIEKEKELTLHLTVTNGELEACSATGDIGTIHWSAFHSMGLPSDQYSLTLVVDGATPTLSYTTLDNCLHQHPSTTLPFTRDIKTLHVSTSTSTLATFDTYEIDGVTHWLHTITPITSSLDNRISQLFDGHDLPLQADDHAKTTTWKAFEAHLHDLHNKLARVQLLKERVVSRYAASPDEGWFAVFGDAIDFSRSSLSITTDDAYRQSDLVDGQRAVRDVEQCLQSSRATRVAAPVDEIVRSLYTSSTLEMTPKELTRACDRHSAIISILLDMRGDIVGTLKERRSLGTAPDHRERVVTRRGVWNSCYDSEPHRDASIVENRVYYLTLAAVDAGLRGQAALLCNLSDSLHGLTQTELDIKLLRYQLRQIYANNQWNEIQLSGESFQRASEAIDKIITLTQSPTNTPVSEPVLVDIMPFQLQKRLAYNRILESFARTHLGAPDISLTTNFIYTSGTCLGAKGRPNNPTQLRLVLRSMIVADQQNRVITPLVSRFLNRIASRPDLASADDIETAISVFHANARPFVRMALTSEAMPDPFHFLDSPETTTGYDDCARTSLLIRLMFHRKAPRDTL